MIKLPTKKTNMLFGLDILFLIIVATVFVGSIIYVRGLQSEIDQKQAELENEVLISSGLQGIKQALNDSEGHIRTFNQYFIDTESTITFLDQIETLGRSQGLDIRLNISSDLTPVEDENTQLSALEITVFTTGDLLATTEFYRALVLRPQYLGLSNLTLTRSGNLGSDQLGEEIEDPVDSWNSSAHLTVYQHN